MGSPVEHEGSSPAQFLRQASAIQAVFTFLVFISGLVPGHQGYCVPVRFPGSIFLLRLTTPLTHHREMIFQSCWICFWSIKTCQEREGYSNDILKSYSVMSTSPQACALTPESLVSHRDLLQVYTELWPWNFVWSLFIILLVSFHLYLKLFPWLYFRQPLRKYSFFFSEITLPGVAVVPKVVWIGPGLCPMTSQ